MDHLNVPIKNKIAKRYVTHLLNPININLPSYASRRFEDDLDMPRV